MRSSKHLVRVFRSLAVTHLHFSFFPEPIDPSLLQMIDSEASKHRSGDNPSSGDSLHDVLFKDPPVTPPPVAVNMYLPPRPPPPARFTSVSRACRSAVGACGLAAPECLRQRPRLKFLFDTR